MRRVSLLSDVAMCTCRPTLWQHERGSACYVSSCLDPGRFVGEPEMKSELAHPFDGGREEEEEKIGSELQI